MKELLGYLPLLVSIVVLIISLQAWRINKETQQAANSQNNYLDEQDLLEVKRLSLAGHKPEAMKIYRNVKNCGLKEAKTYVEKIISGNKAKLEMNNE
jgi:ribosomal protein L7/L12